MAKAVTSHSISQRPTTTAKDDHEEVREGIRELLKHLEPLIKVTGSSANVHGMLAYLEEASDEKFNNLKVISWIQSKLKEAITSLVAEEVNSLCPGDDELTTEQMKQHAPAILARVMASGEVRECQVRLRRVMSAVVEEMRRNFDSECEVIAEMKEVGGNDVHKQLMMLPEEEDYDYEEVVRMSRLDDRHNFSRQQSQESMDQHHRQQLMFQHSFSRDEDSLGSTWHQSSFVFLQPQEYTRLGEKLNRFCPTEVRVEALSTLLRSQLSEVASSAAWASIRDGLQSALLDPNAALSAQSLKIHARLLTATTTAFAAKEAYASLVSAVVGLYQDKTRLHGIPTLSGGLAVKKKRSHFALAQVLALLVESNRFLSRHWNRYPEKYVEEIVGGMVGLMATKGLNKKLVYPIHLLALVDPEARWLKMWLHGNFGRRIFIRKLQASDAVVKFIFSYVVSTLENKTAEEWALVKDSFRSSSSAKGKENVPEPLLSYGLFCQCLHVSTMLLQYESTHQLLPVSPRQYVSSLVNFVSVKYSASVRGPAALVTKCLLNMGSRSQSARNLLLSSEVLDSLLLPMRVWYNRTKAGNSKDGEVWPTNSCQIASHFLRWTTTTTTTTLSSETIGFVIQFCVLAFEVHQSTDAEFQHGVLDVCGSLGCMHSGCLHLRFPRLVKVLLEVLTELVDNSLTPTNSVTNLRDKLAEEENRDEDVLLNHYRRTLCLLMSSSPRGLSIVMRDSNVEEVIPRGSSNELLPLLAFTERGVRLIGSGQISAVQKMLETFCDDREDSPFQIDHSEHERREQNVVALFAQMLTSFGLVKLAIVGNEKEEDQTRKRKLSLRHLLTLDESLFLDHNKIMLALKLLSSLMTALDNYVFMERSLGMRKMLEEELKRSSYLVNAENVTLIDERTLYLKFILGTTGSLGGATERPFPDLDVHDESSWHLEDNKPSRTESREPHASSHKIMNSHDPGQRWLENAREQFLVLDVRFLLPDLLEQAAKSWKTIQGEIICDAIEVTRLSDRQDVNTVALALITDYSARLGLGDFSTTGSAAASEDRFDWFSAVVSMSSSSNDDDDDGKRLAHLLRQLSTLSLSPFLWPARGRILCKEKSMGDDEIPVSYLGHWTDHVLSRESAQVSACLRREDVSVPALCCQWTNQCFLNVLPWPEVCRYVALVVFFGPDYAVYFCAAVMSHLVMQQQLLRAQQKGPGSRHLAEKLRSTSAEGFRCGDYMAFMEKLADKYGEAVLEDFSSLLKKR